MICCPVSAIVYNIVGIAPLFVINAVSFFAAAVMETQIKAKENYIDVQKENMSADKSHTKVMFKDIKEGLAYLMQEKGLLAVAIYFAFSCLAMGASSVITLPYFKGNYENGEFVYMFVWGMSVIGRTIGGTILYRIKFPVKWKYTIALVTYITVNIVEGIYLYLNIPTMMTLCFISGLLGVTSYNIRVSATQSYVPDEKKGRFNGAFNMLNTSGSLAGEVIAGALTVFLPVRWVLSGFMGLAAIAAIIVIGGNRDAVKKIYNREQ